MNEIKNNFLLAQDKFMSGTHFKRPGSTYSSCGPFTKKKEIIQKFKETGGSGYIYQNKLDKTLFQHYMAYGDFKDLLRKTTSGKVLHDMIKHLILLKNPNYHVYQRGLAAMVKCFDKMSSGCCHYSKPTVS